MKAFIAAVSLWLVAVSLQAAAASRTTTTGWVAQCEGKYVCVEGENARWQQATFMDELEPEEEDVARESVDSESDGELVYSTLVVTALLKCKGNTNCLQRALLSMQADMTGGTVPIRFVDTATQSTVHPNELTDALLEELNPEQNQFRRKFDVNVAIAAAVLTCRANYECMRQQVLASLMSASRGRIGNFAAFNTEELEEEDIAPSEQSLSDPDEVFRFFNQLYAKSACDCKAGKQCMQLYISEKLRALNDESTIFSEGISAASMEDLEPEDQNDVVLSESMHTHNSSGVFYQLHAAKARYECNGRRGCMTRKITKALIEYDRAKQAQIKKYLKNAVSHGKKAAVLRRQAVHYRQTAVRLWNKASISKRLARKCRKSRHACRSRNVKSTHLILSKHASKFSQKATVASRQAKAHLKKAFGLRRLAKYWIIKG